VPFVLNIVWAKAGGLLPLTAGGRIRSYNILKWLSQKHSVALFTYYPAVENDEHPRLREIFKHVKCFPIASPEKRRFAEYVAYARNLFSVQPYSVSKYYDSEVAEGLKAYLSANPCDVLICDFLFSAPVIPWDFACPKVFFSHNVEALIWKRQFHATKNPAWKAVSWREWRLTERLEQEYMHRVDHVVAVSDVDRKVFTEFIPPEKITVIPTGVDTEYFSPADPAFELPNTLVFTGSMDWRPNEDAILYFAREILPLVRDEVPDIALWVVGRTPSRAIRNLEAQHPEIHVTGTVDDVRPYIAKASVYIVPIRVGSGTRLKIFEAMSMAKAVVSTPIGAEGLPVAHSENILLAASKEEFADSVLTLLRSAERRRALADAARQLVVARCGASAIGVVFEEALMCAIRESSYRRSSSAPTAPSEKV
jgi:polysaccharide biosynthesis protein PslH